MAERKSEFPRGESLSKPMQAYLEKMELNRRPSDTTLLDTGTATTAEIAARFNQLLIDLNK